MSDSIMPKWLTRDDKGVFHADMDVAMPEWLAALKSCADKKAKLCTKHCSCESPSEFWLKIARMCVELQVREVAVASGLHDDDGGAILRVNLHGAKHWNPAKHKAAGPATVKVRSTATNLFKAVRGHRASLFAGIKK